MDVASTSCERDTAISSTWRRRTLRQWPSFTRRRSSRGQRGPQLWCREDFGHGPREAEIDGREVSVALSGGCVSLAGAGSPAQTECDPREEEHTRASDDLRQAESKVQDVQSQASLMEVWRAAPLFQVLHRQQAKLKKALHNLKFLTDKVSKSKTLCSAIRDLERINTTVHPFDRDSVAHILLLDLVELCVQRHADQFVIERGWRSRPGGQEGLRQL